ncbi:MAG TPA: histidine kinase dimerization/phospho-acceptor domain-containing protein [Acidimicrobiales bacterium]|nr:histidine kinase dimerization/phospho-acceptor domain-containing protein [Acidimicrobiales bacterium]
MAEVPVYQDAVVFLIVAMVLAMALFAVSLTSIVRGRRLRHRIAELGSPPVTTAAPTPVVTAGVSPDAERFSGTLDGLAQGVVVCDDRGQVLYRNPAASAQLRPTSPEPRVADAFGTVLAAALTGAHTTRDLELLGPPRRNLHLIGLPLESDGRRVGAAVVVEDRTRVRVAEVLRREMLSDLVRELTEPMVALGLVADSLQNEEDPAVRARFAERAKTESARARQVLDDLVELSRLAAERPRPAEKVPMADVLARAIERVAALAERRMVTVVAPVVPDEAVLVGDPHQLDLTVAKLLEHVVLGSRTGGKVELAVRLDRGLVALEARQAALSLAGARPPGLALSLVEQAVVNLGGSLDTDSDARSGVCCLRLPLAVPSD